MLIPDTFGKIKHQFTIDNSTPLGLPKILKELDEKGTIRVLHRNAHRSYDFDQLGPLLFRSGYPDHLSKNLEPTQARAMFQNGEEDSQSVWTTIRGFFRSKEGRRGLTPDKLVADTSIIVHLDMLEAKLAEVPPKLEAFVQSQRVLKKKELSELLEEKFGVKGTDRKVMMHFLLKFQFVRRVKRDKNVFYIIGEKKSEKAEDVEINVRIMEMGLRRMETKQVALSQEVRSIKARVKGVREEREKKQLMMECVAKAKVVHSIKKKMLLLQNRIEQYKGVAEDIGMGRLIQGTPLDVDMLHEAREIIQDGVQIQQEIGQVTSSINMIIGQTQAKDEDLEQIYAAMGSDGEPNADFEDLLEKSGIKVTGPVREQRATREPLKEPQLAQFATDTNLERDLLESKDKMEEGPKILGIEDVKRYQQEKFGEHTGREEVAEGKVLVFNGGQNGLRREGPGGASFGEYKRQKASDGEGQPGQRGAENDLMEFEDTFKGTHKQSSSARGLSEFTINKTVSNLDQRPDAKNVGSLADNKATSNITYENRKAKSHERQQEQTGFFSKIKEKVSKVFASGKKETLDSNKQDQKTSGRREDSKEPENDYAVDFTEQRQPEETPGQREPRREAKKSKNGSSKSKKLNQTMEEITKPNDISVVNLTKKSPKPESEKPHFQSPSSKARHDEAQATGKRKSTGKDMSFDAWGQNSIKLLKKDVQ